MKTVMIIDDEPFILMMLEDKLQRAGYRVITSRRSKGVLDVVRRERPDLIILDWMMPEVSGINVCRQLKADSELEGIPIFMLTARGQEEDEQAGLRCGVARYITKPFSPRMLLELIDKEIGGAMTQQ